MPTVDASALERQAIKLVSGLVEKFGQIETLLRDKTIVDLVQYYRDFTLDEAPLQMLAYLSKHGDDNVAVHDYRKKNGGGTLPEELALKN
jgi:hypothetical protein